MWLPLVPAIMDELDLIRSLEDRKHQRNILVSVLWVCPREYIKLWYGSCENYSMSCHAMLYDVKWRYVMLFVMFCDVVVCLP